MNANMLSARLFGDTEVATPLEIVASGVLYEAGFSTPKQKTRNRSFSPPFGHETARLGKTIEEDWRAREHHQPLCHIHLSGREIRLKERSHLLRPRRC